MSRLEELIEQLCPDGVEWVALDKVIISLNTGLNPRRFFKLNTDDATNYYVTIRELQNDCVVFSDKTDRINDTALKLCNNRSNLEVGDVLFSGTGTIGETAIITSPPVNWNIKEGVYAIKPNPVLIEPKFLMHLLKMKEIRKQFLSKAAGGTVKSVPMGELKKIAVPLPPLEVQREIVRILDQFTELTAELTAELSARKRQYEYYTNILLSFDENIPVVQLRNIVDFRNGKGHEKDIVADGKYIVVNSKFISTSGEVKKYSNKQICPLYIDDILMVMSDLPSGRALAKCFVVQENDKYSLNQRIGAFHVKDENIITTKFLFYVLNRNRQLLRYDNGADQTNLRKDDILDIQIPLPALSQQHRIVSILDRFDTLCNDLTSGLPAEIEARRKQYEYYRDKLLTFRDVSEG